MSSFAFDSMPYLAPQPGKWMSLAFTVLMHVLLALVLFFGVQWQRHTPEAVSVELVRSLPPVQMPVVVSPPVKVVKPVPMPEVREPEPVKPPDIAIKQPKPVPPKHPPVQEKPKPAPMKVEEKKIEPKPTRNTAVADEASPTSSYQDRLKQLMGQDADKVQRQVLANNNRVKTGPDTGVGLSKATSEWGDQIEAAVKPQIILPPGLTGRPTAEFEIQLLPSGKVLLPLRLTRSSGNPALDDAIERAIEKASPLPLPAKAEVFVPRLKLTFDPLK